MVILWLYYVLRAIIMIMILIIIATIRLWRVNEFNRQSISGDNGIWTIQKDIHFWIGIREYTPLANSKLIRSSLHLDLYLSSYFVVQVTSSVAIDAMFRSIWFCEIKIAKYFQLIRKVPLHCLLKPSTTPTWTQLHFRLLQKMTYSKVYLINCVRAVLPYVYIYIYIYI